ncbi:MAG: tyrosine-type recombinase/integrase [Chlorobi bacterium]|nr:tyrosine-type recombinase/integrase [Chlorobiota bacterium]
MKSRRDIMLARDKDKGRVRIYSERYTIGYAAPINGIWCTRMGNLTGWMSTGVPVASDKQIARENERLVRSILDERCKAFVTGGVDALRALSRRSQILKLRTVERNTGVFQPGKAKTLQEAIREFEKAKLPLQAEETRRHYKQAFAHFFPPEPVLPLPRTEEAMQTVVAFFMSVRSNSTLQDTTMRKYMKWVRKVFNDFLVPLGYALRDPMKLVGIPRDKRKIAVAVFTPDEILKILDYADGLKRSRSAYDGLMMLWGTGMRPVELRRIQRRHVVTAPDGEIVGLVIQGKRGNDSEVVPRHFPFFGTDSGGKRIAVFEDALAALKRAMAKADRDDHAFLFPQCSNMAVNGWVKDAMLAKGIESVIDPDAGERTAYSIRASAKHHMVHVRRIPKWLADEIMGHTEAVSNHHYWDSPDVAEATALLGYHAELAQIVTEQNKEGLTPQPLARQARRSKT